MVFNVPKIHNLGITIHMYETLNLKNPLQESLIKDIIDSLFFQIVGS